MTRRTEYRATLRDLGEYHAGAVTAWDPFLLANSGLPGPRGNLELAQAVADEGTEEQFRRWLSLGPDQAPVNSPEEFLAFCGILGMGTLLAGAGETSVGGSQSIVDGAPAPPQTARDSAAVDQASSVVEPRLTDSPLQVLRRFAADPRWRSREAVAMALQRWGDANMETLLQAMVEWGGGTPWEQRAAAAALCEPRLLVNPLHAAATLRILDAITTSLRQNHSSKSEAFRVLRQGLGYCWSVAVAACPEEGKALMEKWFTDPDPDIRWIMRENLRKNRLAKMDPDWSARWVVVV
jgi:hypothetical protein